jgi:hypothetical protein
MPRNVSPERYIIAAVASLGCREIKIVGITLAASAFSKISFEKRNIDPPNNNSPKRSPDSALIRKKKR